MPCMRYHSRRRNWLPCLQTWWRKCRHERTNLNPLIFRWSELQHWAWAISRGYEAEVRPVCRRWLKKLSKEEVYSALHSCPISSLPQVIKSCLLPIHRPDGFLYLALSWNFSTFSWVVPFSAIPQPSFLIDHAFIGYWESLDRTRSLGLNNKVSFSW